MFLGVGARVSGIDVFIEIEPNVAAFKMDKMENFLVDNFKFFIIVNIVINSIAPVEVDFAVVEIGTVEA